MTYEEEETQDGAARSTDSLSHEDSFALAVGELVQAKALEAQANTRRLDAEANVLRFVATKDEGTVTVSAGDYKLTVTYGVNRTLDRPALAAVRSGMAPELFERAIEYRPAIDLAGLRYLRNNEPQAYAVLAQAITAKPAKPSLRIEPVTPNKEP